MKPFDIFKPGTHVAMDGQRIEFTEADLRATADAYDPDLHEAPIVVGHPKTDDPAFGWVGALAVDGGRLRAVPRQVDADFAELVTKGRYKKVSASFYRPDAKSNPVPGVYYLRHVGFLGAQPPAVKGLGPIQFAEDDEEIIVFSEYMDRSIARVFRRLREFFIAEFGDEKAEKALPGWEVDNLQDAATRPEASPAFSEGDRPIKTQENDMAENSLAERSKQLDQREAAIAKREADFAEKEKSVTLKANAIARAECASFLDGLVREGRFPPGHKDAMAEFLCRLDDSEAIQFGEGEEGKLPARAFLMAFLKGLPKSVEFSEIARDGRKPTTRNFQAPPGYAVDSEQLELHEKAIAYQEQHPNTDYITAVRAVGGE